MATGLLDHPPDFARPFCYQQLDRNKQCLRLFKLSRVKNDGILVCTLRQAEMTENYVALSYVWGPEEPSHIVRISDANTGHEGFLRVRANLFNFLLRAACSEPDVFFWTDAVCINQQNILERNHQVSQMGAIYHNAEHVRIWLGEDPWTGNMLSTISTVADSGSCSIDDLFHEKTCPAEFSSIFERKKRSGFFKNKYWTRSWIIQEVVLAKKIIVQSTDGSTPWTNLIGLIAPDEDQQSIVMQNLLSDWTVTPFAMPPFRLGFILNAFGDTECTETHDRLYAFLALIEDGAKVEVDYGAAPSEVLIEAVKVLKVKDDDLLPLLKALRMDVSSLYNQSRLETQDLQKTQRVLAANRHILVTKLVFPLCSADGYEPCEWSVNGTEQPCRKCHASIQKICEMPECAHGWLVQVIELLELNVHKPGIFSNTYLSHFKNWLCSMWPDELAGVHEPSTEHCTRCYACDLRVKTYNRGQDEPHTMEEIEAIAEFEVRSALANLPGLHRAGPVVRLSNSSSASIKDDDHDPLDEMFWEMGPNVIMFGMR